MSDSDTLDAFFDKVRNAGTFSLKAVKEDANTAETAYKALLGELESLKAEHTLTCQKLSDAESLSGNRSSEISTLNTRVSDVKQQSEQLQSEIDTLKKDKASLEEKLSAMTNTAKANADSAEQWKAAEEERRGELADLKEEYNTLSASHSDIASERDTLLAELDSERKSHQADSGAADTLSEKYQSLEADYDAMKAEHTVLQAEVSKLEAERDEKFARLSHEAEKFAELSTRFTEEKMAADEAALEKIGAAFASHHDKTGSTLRNICEEYDVPFKSGEVFDLKINGSTLIVGTAVPDSVKSMETFSTIVSIKAKEILESLDADGVRGEAYLVVPTLAAEYLSEFEYRDEGSSLFVVTPEALFGVVRTLKTIEEYEFAEQLTPFELEQLCRFIGELSHMTKRKIQLDTYFSNEMLAVLQRSENFPLGVSGSISENEAKTKMNPPRERSQSSLTAASLSSKVQKLEKAMLARAATAEVEPAFDASEMFEISESKE